MPVAGSRPRQCVRASACEGRPVAQHDGLARPQMSGMMVRSDDHLVSASRRPRCGHQLVIGTAAASRCRARRALHSSGRAERGLQAPSFGLCHRSLSGHRDQAGGAVVAPEVRGRNGGLRHVGATIGEAPAPGSPALITLGHEWTVGTRDSSAPAPRRAPGMPGCPTKAHRWPEPGTSLQVRVDGRDSDRCLPVLTEVASVLRAEDTWGHSAFSCAPGREAARAWNCKITNGEC